MSDNLSAGQEPALALESDEALRRFLDPIRDQLRKKARERSEFLESAIEELEAVEGLARSAGDAATAASLGGLAARATSEREAIRRVFGTSPEALDPAEVSAPSAAEVVPAATVAEIGPDETTANGRSPAVAPDVAAPLPSPPAVERSIPQVPPLSLGELTAEAEALLGSIEREESQERDEAWIVRGRISLCLLKALHADFRRHDAECYLLDQARDRIRSAYGEDNYLIGLKAARYPKEPWPWRRLEELYGHLLTALVARDRYEATRTTLTDGQRKRLLNGIAASQSLIYRHLADYYPGEHDPHQEGLFEWLKVATSAGTIRLACMRTSATPHDLQRAQADLGAVLGELDDRERQREEKEHAIEQLQRLVSAEDFGFAGEDEKALEEAVLRCRRLGIPASRPELRDPLMDWLPLLATSEEKAVREVANEVKRKAKREAGDVLRADEPLEPEPDMLAAELKAVRREVRGQKCLFIGGQERDESRRRLEKELGLSELVWPDTTGRESVYKFEPYIQAADIVVILVRFMRTGWGEARELAKLHGKRFVRLKAGYGLNQVVRHFYDQLVRKRSPEASKAVAAAGGSAP